MGRGVGELQNALELTCNVSCTLLCIHATAAFPLSSPLNLMLAIGDLFSALLLLLLPSSAISATCLRDCQLLLDCWIVVAVSSSPPPPTLSHYSLLLLYSPYLALSLSLSLSHIYIYIYIYDSNFELGSIWWISTVYASSVFRTYRSLLHAQDLIKYLESLFCINFWGNLVLSHKLCIWSKLISQLTLWFCRGRIHIY